MPPADLDPAALVALGRAVRELRARRGLSQEALGHRGGLHRNYVGAIERGEINPTFRVFLKLERGLSLPLSELIDTYERQRWALDTSAPTVTPHGRHQAAGPSRVSDADATGPAQRAGALRPEATRPLSHHPAPIPQSASFAGTDSHEKH